MNPLPKMTTFSRMLPALAVAIAAQFAVAANPFGKSASESSRKPFGKTKTCADPEAPITVKIMKRNLDFLGERARSLSEDAVHYHSVAYGADGTYLGDFGWTGEGNPLKDIAGSKGKVFSEPTEKRFLEDYDPEPVAEANVTFGDWELARNQFEYNEGGSGYKLTNNGFIDYHNPAMVDGKESFNCQFAMSRFWDELKNTQSFQSVKDFEWPGGNIDTLTFLGNIRNAMVGGRNGQPGPVEQTSPIVAPTVIDTTALASLLRQILAQERNILPRARTLLASADAGSIPQTLIEQYNAAKNDLVIMLRKFNEEMQETYRQIDSLPLSDEEKARLLDRSVPEEANRRIQEVIAEIKPVANEILAIEGELKSRHSDKIKFLSLSLDTLP